MSWTYELLPHVAVDAGLVGEALRVGQRVDALLGVAALDARYVDGHELLACRSLLRLDEAVKHLLIARHLIAETEIRSALIRLL